MLPFIHIVAFFLTSTIPLSCFAPIHTDLLYRSGNHTLNYLSRAGRYSCLTLNNEKTKNALSHDDLSYMKSVLQHDAKVGSIQGIFFDSVDPKFLSSGADISQFLQRHKLTKSDELTGTSIQGLQLHSYPLLEYLDRYTKPTCSLMRGWSVGTGAGMGLRTQYSSPHRKQ